MPKAWPGAKRRVAVAGAREAGGDSHNAAVRAHLLRLKDEHHYSPSSMRSAVSAMRGFYGLHLGRDWKLFDLVRSPSAQKLPTVLTREEIARLFTLVRVGALPRQARAPPALSRSHHRPRCTR